MKNDDRQVVGFSQFCIGQLAEGNGLTVKQMAKKTKLCASTLYRLKKGLGSTKTHIGTIQKLGKAVGAKLSLDVID